MLEKYYRAKTLFKKKEETRDQVVAQEEALKVQKDTDNNTVTI